MKLSVIMIGRHVLFSETRGKALASIHKMLKQKNEGPQALSQQTTVKVRTIEGVTKTIIYKAQWKLTS